jgi:antitoxin YefM
MTTTQVSLAEAKAHLSALVERVRGQHDRVTVTVHGRPSAMLVSLDDISGLEETVAILSDETTVVELIQSEQELARGEAVSADELASAMAARRAAAT